MEILDELESMARHAALSSDSSCIPGSEDIQRWELLFGYTAAEARERLQEQRADLCPPTVSPAHWEMVRAEKEAEGYDKKAYEHACRTARTTAARPKPDATKTSKRPNCLAKLGGPLTDPEPVMISGRSAMPPPHHGTDDDGQRADIYIVDTATKDSISRSMATLRLLLQPDVFGAAKALSADSLYPTLGVDSTMPQHRPSSPTDPRLSPAPHEFPVYYFFYGTLTDPAVLGRFVAREPVLRPARIGGGILASWAGRYKALVDAPPGHVPEVSGCAFCVWDQEEEDALRRYETDHYEVVRCEMEVAGMGLVRGLVFRFVGDRFSELDEA